MNKCFNHPICKNESETEYCPTCLQNGGIVSKDFIRSDYMKCPFCFTEIEVLNTDEEENEIVFSGSCKDCNAWLEVTVGEK